jgi:AraC-like DNA-binding protein
MPFLDYLDRIGAPVERGLERSKLPPNLRERPDILASTRAGAAFLADMAWQEGIEDLGWRAASTPLDETSPDLARALRRSPTLLCALERLCVLASRESSQVQIWLEEEGDSVFLCHRDALELGAPGADEVNTFQAATALSIVRIFAPSDWVPPECGLAFEGRGLFIREELGGTRIQRTPDFTWFRLPRSILARRPREAGPAETRPGTQASDGPALDLVGSLVQVLRPYLAGRVPSLHDAADLAGTSVRSLQRELARAGSSYRDVLQRVKLDAARELLEQPDVRILEVAYETGFRDPAHFTRFFGRLAGMTPREYRTFRLED